MATCRPIVNRPLEFLHFVWWGRRFRLPTSAGPWPTLCGAREPSRHRIPLDIGYRAAYLTRTTQVMIVGFVLPEPLPRSAQDAVGASSRRSFQPSHQNRDGDLRQNQQVPMIRHYHPGIKFIEVPLAFSDQNCIRHHTGDSRIPQPQRTRSALIQNAILSHECMAGGGVHDAIRWGREGSPQTPGQEQIPIVRMEMWQSSAILRHLEGRQAKPPAPPIPCFCTPENLIKCRNSSAGLYNPARSAICTVVLCS